MQTSTSGLRVAERTLVITSSPPSWSALAEITCRHMKAWCDRHGYTFYADVSDLRDRNPLTGERVAIKGFVKFDLFLHFLPKYDRVIWLDSDMLLTNIEPSIDELTWESPHALILPFEHNAHNATVIIMRSNDLTYDFAWAVNNTGRKLFLGHDWVEMEAMRYFLMTPPYEDLVTYISAKRLCPILHSEYIDAGLPARVSEKYSWEEGDWSLHLSALHINRRIELAQEWSTRFPCA